MMARIIMTKNNIVSSGDEGGLVSVREQAELILSVLVFGTLAALLLAFGPVGLMG